MMINKYNWYFRNHNNNGYKKNYQRLYQDMDVSLNISRLALTLMYLRVCLFSKKNR